MRIPVDKLYRAFPELDQFSDEQCERFIQRCRQSELSGNASVAVFWSVIAAGLACLTGNCLGMGWISEMMDQPPRGHLFAPIMGVLLFAWMFVPTIAGLLARDWALRRNLRRLIWRNIERIRCLQCRYLLLGQRVVNGLVHCPECGASTTLEALGLESEQDLIPPKAIEDELTPEARG